MNAQGTQDCLAILAFLASEVFLECLVILDLWELWARKERRVMEDVLETLETKALGVTMELMDLQEHLVFL